MAATTSGALKAYVEGMGLGLPVFRDGVPTDRQGQQMLPPYMVVHEGLAVVPLSFGDFGDPARDFTVTELVQLDLWEPARTPGGQAPGQATAGEVYTRPRSLLRGLDGATLPASPTRVWSVRVQHFVRTLQDGMVRTRFDLLVTREA